MPRRRPAKGGKAAQVATPAGRSRQTPATGLAAAPPKIAASPPPPAASPTGRAQKAAARRQAILAAALDEFSARGFAAARLDDVAERAGVAKGTIYLHFADKEALFQEIVRTMVVPLVLNVEAAPPDNVPTRLVLERLIAMFVREVYGTRRREIVRLIMTEGPRFPALAEFYYHEVVERGIAAMRALLARAAARGELRSDGIARYPHIVVAPLMLSIIWSGLFDRFAPIDVAALMRAHLDLIFDKERAS
jgi:AcrR family transcriptional regulator